MEGKANEYVSAAPLRIRAEGYAHACCSFSTQRHAHTLRARTSLQAGVPLIGLLAVVLIVVLGFALR